MTSDLTGLHDRQLRAFFEHALDAMVVTNDAAAFVDVNPAACHLFGLEREHLLGRRIVDFTEPGFDFEATWAEFRHEQQVKGEFHLIRPNGEVRVVECFATANFIPHFHLSVLRDITERKQAEAALRLSELRYRAIVEDQSELICRSLPDGRLTFANQAYCRYFGKTVDELIGQSFMPLIPEDDQAYVEEQLRSLSPEHPSITYEHRVYRDSGEVCWQQWIDRALFSPTGELLEIQSVGRDVTPQKEAERALHQLNQELELRVAERTAELHHALDYLQFHAENSPLAFVGCDHELRVEFWSQRAEQIFGWKTGEVLGRHWAELNIVHPDDQTTVLSAINRLLSGESQVICVNRNLHKDGTIIHCEWYNSARLDDQGNVNSILSLVHDVSDRAQLAAEQLQIEAERKQAEAALRLSEAKFASAFHASPDAMSITMPESGEIVDVNDSFCQLTGYQREEVIGHSIVELNLWFNLDERNRLIHYLQTEGSIRNLEVQFRDRSGEKRTILMSAEQIVVNDETCILAVSKDITERKQFEDELRSQAQREQLLRNITEHIHRSLDLNQILTTTVTEVRQVLQADRVLVYRFKPDWSGVIAVESVVEPWLTTLGTSIKDPCFGEAYVNPYRQGRIQATDDIFKANLKRCHIDLLTSFQVKANLVVPILQASEELQPDADSQAPVLWGLLIAHQCGDSRHWLPNEVDLMKQVATQAGIAIQQAEYHRQVQRFNAELERQVQARTAELNLASEFEFTLKRITDRVRDSLDENQILQSAVEELARGLGVNCCNAALFDLNLRTSTICYEYTNGTVSPSQGRVSNMSNFPEIYDQLLHGQYFQFCSLLPHPSRGRVAMLCCPIFDDQGVLGDLWLINQSYYGFSQQDIRLAQQVANQCAIALRQSRLYQTAQAQVQELERLNHLKDDFLSTVSHELRTPMSNIKMATQMLEISLNKAGEFSDKSNSVNRYFQILKDECQREISLINDLLDLTRLDAGTEHLTVEPIDLLTCLPSILEPFLERTSNQQQQLIINLPPDLPTLLSDKSYLERTVTELLNNACKYTSAGETICVDVSTSADAKVLQITIANSGVEIPAHELSRIFDKFYRIPKNDPWKHGGTGLGLALVKKMVERIGGSIHIESANSQTCFCVSLPLA